MQRLFSMPPLRLALHLGLFLLTFFTTTVAGVQWIGANPFELENFSLGLPYSLSLLFILSCHEFGHYFASRHHGVDATLPYYLPFPPFPSLMAMFLNFGTFGAIIRTRSVVPSKRAIFDIGVAGPIAGFVASVIVLVYGFTHLPAREFILTIHPDYDFSINASTGGKGIGLAFGDTLLFAGLRWILTNPAAAFVPPMSEVYHYPYLCVGWFGFFVTALNLLPMGQFDGGHISYAMFGNRHRTVSRWTFLGLIALSLPSLLDVFFRTILGMIRGHDVGPMIPFTEYSWWAWFAWALIAYYVVKLYHPAAPDETPLDHRRIVIGWIAIAIFVLSFSPIPIVVSQ